MYKPLTNPSLHILQQLWKDVSYEIEADSPSPTWWKNTGSHNSVFCNDHIGNEGGHFENFLSGSSNSENMLQKLYVHNFYCITRRTGISLKQ